MGKILWEMGVFIYPKKLGTGKKGAYLPIVLNLYTSKIKVPLCRVLKSPLSRDPVSVISDL